jgi:uncharacterized cupredoxin-like copper-binding protein
MKMRKSLVVAVLCAAFSTGVLAQHGGHSSKAATPFGQPGDPKKVSRTVDVDMSDRMRFAPAEIQIRRGETVRFRVKNSGQTLHEMVIGTPDGLKKHAEDMRKHPGMKHDAPYLTHVAPGKNGTIVWQFTQAGEFEYACLVPGHFEAGMMGRIRVAEEQQHKH